MTKTELFKRYVLFFLSVVIQGISISFISYADIGTTPISSPNFVLSLHSSLTLGDTTFIFNILLIILQIMFICIGEDRLISHIWRLLMQIPVCIIFSFMIDASTWTLQQILPSDFGYTICWLLVITGTLMLALAVAMSFTASVAMVPGEYFIKIFHPLVKRSFSFVKTFFDIFLVSSAVVISFVLTDFTAIEGVREGTVFAALSTGPLVHFFIPRMAKLNTFLSK